MRFTKKTYERTRDAKIIEALAARGQDSTRFLKLQMFLRLLGNRARREKGMWR